MKKFARIVGTGSYLPPRIITNSELEKSLDTTDEWITSRTGIKERRIVEDQNTCDLALEASINALEMAELLKDSSLNYSGFVEGDDIFKGVVDVVVCDGFEGNIALKASEGVANMFSHLIKESFNKNLLTKLVAIFAKPVMNNFKSKVDPGQYNGASLLGLKGVVVKSHGNADVDSYFQAIKEAYLEAHAKITDKISLQLTRELEEHK